jgi:hypothetical protein
MLIVLVIAVALLIRWIGVQLAIMTIVLRIENPCQGERS